MVEHFLSAMTRRDRRVAALKAIPARELKSFIERAGVAGDHGSRLVGLGAEGLRELALLEWQHVERHVFGWLDGAKQPPPADGGGKP